MKKKSNNANLEPSLIFIKGLFQKQGQQNKISNNYQKLLNKLNSTSWFANYYNKCIDKNTEKKYIFIGNFLYRLDSGLWYNKCPEIKDRD